MVGPVAEAVQVLTVSHDGIVGFRRMFCNRHVVYCTGRIVSLPSKKPRRWLSAQDVTTMVGCGQAVDLVHDAVKALWHAAWSAPSLWGRLHAGLDPRELLVNVVCHRAPHCPRSAALLCTFTASSLSDL